MAARNFLKKTVYWPALFLCVLSLGGASVSLGYQHAGAVLSGYGEAINLGTISKIVSVLEIRSSDPKILDKAAENSQQ
ncbi:MAG: hypothetical protein ACYDAA_10310 [Syntrophales bacterium]